MKNIKAALFILIAVVTLQACNHSAKTDDNDGDTNNAAPDTSTAVATAPPDTTGPKIHLIIDREDSIFAVTASRENLAEIELGQLAIKNAKGKRFKNFGWLMVKDHGKANNKLMAMAQLKKLPLPSKIDSTEQNKITQLAKKTGGDFNNAYVAMMLDDGKKDVKVFTDASTKTQDPDIKSYAKKTLPVIQKHLDAINAIHDSMSQ